MGQLNYRLEILNRSFELDQGRHGREEYDYLSFFLMMEITDEPSEIVAWPGSGRSVPSHAARNGKRVSCFRSKAVVYRHWGWRTGNQCGGNKRCLRSDRRTSRRGRERYQRQP